MIKYKVIDNFLEKNFFKNFKKLMFSENINWYWRNKTVVNEKDSFYFTHSFYNDWKINSAFFSEYINPVLIKLNCFTPIQIRANLTINQKKNNVSFHTDYNIKESKTAILYMNTCNSCTVLSKNEKIKIKSKENRLLIFDSLIEHSVLLESDVLRRIVINFNFFEKDILNNKI